MNWKDVIRKTSSTEEEAEKLIKECLKIQREEKKKMMTEEEIQAGKLKTKERNLKKKDKQKEWKLKNKEKVKEYQKVYNKMYYEKSKG